MESLRTQLELALNSGNITEAMRCLRVINERNLVLTISYLPVQPPPVFRASQRSISPDNVPIDLSSERTISLHFQDSGQQIGRQVPNFPESTSRSVQSFTNLSLASDPAAFDESRSS